MSIQFVGIVALFIGLIVFGVGWGVGFTVAMIAGGQTPGIGDLSFETTVGILFVVLWLFVGIFRGSGD